MGRSNAKSRRMPIVEHFHQSMRLAAAATDVTVLSVNLSRIYGRRHKATLAARAVAKSIGDLRWLMESNLWRDFPELPNEAVQIYYPAKGFEQASAENVEVIMEKIQWHLDNGDNESLDDIIIDSISRYPVEDVRRAIADLVKEIDEVSGVVYEQLKRDEKWTKNL